MIRRTFTIFSFMALAGVMLLNVGCSNKQTGEFENTESTSGHQAEMGYPDWYYTPPREPGMAFYGVGLVTQVKNEALAKQTADDRARRDIAGTLQTKIAAILKSYMRSVLGPDMPDGAEEEQLVQDTMMAIIEGININGAEIVKRDVGKQADDKSWPHLALARIGFDSVAESLYNETKESVQRVQEHAEVAFDELKDLLESSQKEGE